MKGLAAIRPLQYFLFIYYFSCGIQPEGVLIFTYMQLLWPISAISFFWIFSDTVFFKKKLW